MDKKRTTNSEHKIVITPVWDYIAKMKACDQRIRTQMMGAEPLESEEKGSNDFKKKLTPVVTPPVKRKPKTKGRTREKLTKPKKTPPITTKLSSNKSPKIGDLVIRTAYTL